MNQGSGFYQPQTSGYQAFIPRDLPPNPKVKINESLGQKIDATEKKLAQLNAIAFLLPSPDLFIMMAIRKEALLSSQIEGTQATMTDLLTYEAWEEVNNLDDVEEVVNYIKSLNHGIERLKQWPLCFRILKECHSILLSSVRGCDKTPGEFRRSQNWIGHSLKNAIFIPSPHERVPEATGRLEKFINEKEETSPLVKCALIHYQFETIHPFLDGNGRIGRLLVDLYLHWTGLLQKPLVYSSLHLKYNRQEYFDRLMETREKGSYENWVHFFLSSLLWSTDHAMDKIQQVLSLQETLKQKILKKKKPLYAAYNFLKAYLDPLSSPFKASQKNSNFPIKVPLSR